MQNNEERYLYKGIGMTLFDKFAKEYNLVYQHVNMLNFDEIKQNLKKKGQELNELRDSL